MIYSEEAIRKGIPSEIGGVFVYDEIDSTNTEAKRYALSGGTAPALFVADRQTSGRGRLGRSFYSPEGTGIYMSLLLPVKERLEDTLLMTTAAAVAVRRAIRSVCGIETGIKWVNDLYLNDRKVCGILCELLGGESMMIVGVGINLSTRDFPSDISHKAGSLGVLGEGVREALCAACASELYGMWSELQTVGLVEEYKQGSIVIGREVCYVENGQTYYGKAVDIDDRGRLYVEDNTGVIHTLASGEISLTFSFKKEKVSKKKTPKRV